MQSFDPVTLRQAAIEALNEGAAAAEAYHGQSTTLAYQARALAARLDQSDVRFGRPRRGDSVHSVVQFTDAILLLSSTSAYEPVDESARDGIPRDQEAVIALLRGAEVREARLQGIQDHAIDVLGSVCRYVPTDQYSRELQKKLLGDGAFVIPPDDTDYAARLRAFRAAATALLDSVPRPGELAVDAEQVRGLAKRADEVLRHIADHAVTFRDITAAVSGAYGDRTVANEVAGLLHSMRDFTMAEAAGEHAENDAPDGPDAPGMR